MGKPNYQFAKRQKELARKKKKEEKRKRKLESNTDENEGTSLPDDATEVTTEADVSGAKSSEPQ